MKQNLDLFKALWREAPAAAWKGRLTRRVEFLALTAYNPANWLFTSGKPNRFNPAGIHCVYFAGNEDVARMEFEDIWHGRPGAGQPATDFHADVNLTRILDLNAPEILKLLQLKRSQLTANWRLAKKTTLTQLIGQAVSETKLFSSIRYPSIAAARKNRVGVNFVIFPGSLRPPEFVRIVGRTNTPLQHWP